MIGPEILSSSAYIAGGYRYSLTRTFARADDGEPLRWCLWVMLNPSTADGCFNDPTIRRCIGFTHRWGFNALEVVNLCALRTTDPQALLHAMDPYGPDNGKHVLLALARASRVVAAWGAFDLGAIPGPPPLVTPDFISEQAGILDVERVCLGRTKAGHPRHPLYVRGDVEPQPWSAP